jgi:hypothetical protein
MAVRIVQIAAIMDRAEAVAFDGEMQHRSDNVRKCEFTTFIGTPQNCSVSTGAAVAICKAIINYC